MYGVLPCILRIGGRAVPIDRPDRPALSVALGSDAPGNGHPESTVLVGDPPPGEGWPRSRACPWVPLQAGAPSRRAGRTLLRYRGRSAPRGGRRTRASTGQARHELLDAPLGSGDRCAHVLREQADAELVEQLPARGSSGSGSRGIGHRPLGNPTAEQLLRVARLGEPAGIGRRVVAESRRARRQRLLSCRASPAADRSTGRCRR